MRLRSAKPFAFSLIAFTIFAGPLFATNQVLDQCTFEGITRSIQQNPLTAIWMSDSGEFQSPMFDVQSPANWKGYEASWEVKNQKLLLIDFTASRNHKPVDISEVIQSEKLPLHATFFSGEIQFPLGKPVMKSQFGHPMTFTTVISFQIKAENVVAMTIESNDRVTDTWDGLTQTKRIAQQEKNSDDAKHMKPLKTFDATQPFSFELGRGSGLEGLDTITITEDGIVQLYRGGQYAPEEFHFDKEKWYRAEMQLPKDAIKSLASNIDRLRIASLDKKYSSDIHDGTQWIIRLQQSDTSKSIYMNNNFPVQADLLATWLDATLKQQGADKLEWEEVPDGEVRKHEIDLWKSIKD